jgi:universal stress protein A
MKLKKATKNRIQFDSAAESEVGQKFDVIDLVPSIIKLKKILVPIDFSDTSKKALSYAIAFARQFGGKITLLHVVEPYIYPIDPTFAPYPIPVNETGLEKKLELKLSRLKNRFDQELFDPIVVRKGRAFEQVVQVAKEQETDLIILTTHGYTGFKHVFLGSNSERVVQHAPCPVLVVREREHEFA